MHVFNFHGIQRTKRRVLGESPSSSECHSACVLLLLALFWLCVLGFSLICEKFRVQTSHLRTILTAILRNFHVQLGHMVPLFRSELLRSVDCCTNFWFGCNFTHFDFCIDLYNWNVRFSHSKSRKNLVHFWILNTKEASINALISNLGSHRSMPNATHKSAPTKREMK